MAVPTECSGRRKVARRAEARIAAVARAIQRLRCHRRHTPVFDAAQDSLTPRSGREQTVSRRSLMTRVSIATTITGAALLMVVTLVPGGLRAQQRGAGPGAAPAAASEPAPRLADGHPDLSGVWWTGGDVGNRG